MSKKTKNHKEVEQAIDVVDEHGFIVNKVHDLLEKLKGNMTRTKKKENYPNLLEDLEYVTY